MATAQLMALALALASVPGPVRGMAHQAPTTASQVAALMRIDYGSKTGTDSDAKRDYLKSVPWDAVTGNGTSNLVATAASEGVGDWPTPNLLKVRGGWRASPAGAASENHRMTAGAHWAAPAVGQSLYYRWYVRVIIPNTYTVDPLTHPIQDGTNGSLTNWMWEVTNGTDGTWTCSYNVSGNGANAFPNNRWYVPDPLTKGVTYLFEHRIHRIATSTFNLHVWVSSAAGGLLYDNDDIENANASAVLASTPTLTFNDVAALGGMQAGFNGLSGGVQADYPPINLYYQGAHAVSSAGRCGAYGGVVGEVA